MPRPANPEVRSRLLSIGRDVVLDLGFNGSGVQDITAAAGVPKGSFYSYFDSKEAFAVELIEEYWQSIERRHGPILYDARIKPLDRIGRFFSGISNDHRQSGLKSGCLIGNLSLELANVSEEARAQLNDVLARWEGMIAACLSEAQERGQLASEVEADQMASIIVEAYEGAVMRSKIEQDGNAFDRFEAVTLPRLLG